MHVPPEALRGGTVADLIVTATARYPDRTAFANDEARVSYAELGQAISRIALHFDRLGLRPGDTVAQLAVNRWEAFAVIAAVYLRGLRSVTLHALGSEADHAYILAHSGARTLIVDAQHQARGQALRAQCGHVCTWLSMGSIAGFDDLLQAAQDLVPQGLVPCGDAETVVRLAYTGGTTGRPKGVMLTNRALATNALLDLAVKDWPQEVRYVCPAPISHGGGSLVVPTLMRGGCITLLRGFSSDGFVEAVGQYRCNLTWLVPTMLYALLDSPRVKEVDWAAFHTLIYSAAPASPARIRQALDICGPVLVQSYGQTESPNDILLLDRHDHARLEDAQLTAAGRPYPLMQIALLDADGRQVADGERGEICVRGPLVMAGYLDSPAETAAALAGGWLHTGDVARRGADGLYYIVDRMKDVIISGGFNVYPREIEDTLCAQPGVAQAAVIGIPDDRWGELVMAYVQPGPGPRPSTERLVAAVRAAIGAVAAPKRVAFVEALPQTALGKIDKKALRARHWAAGARAVH